LTFKGDYANMSSKCSSANNPAIAAKSPRSPTIRPWLVRSAPIGQSSHVAASGAVGGFWSFFHKKGLGLAGQ